MVRIYEEVKCLPIAQKSRGESEVYCFLLIFRNSLHIVDTNPLLSICFANIFLRFMVDFTFPLLSLYAQIFNYISV